MNTFANTLHDRLSRFRTRVPATDRRLLAWAVVVAISLLSFYVHTLHASMNRAEEQRAARLGAASVPQKSRAAPLPDRRNATDAARLAGAR